MGDIAEQTLAGAISTGTHGTGGVAAGLSAQVVGLELVTGTGEVLRASARREPRGARVARLGLGALGVLTTITFASSRSSCSRPTRQPMSWDEALATFDEMRRRAPPRRHVLVPPHRPDAHQAQRPARRRRPAEAEPLSRFRGWLDDDFLSNRLFGLETATLNRLPRAIPRVNRLNARMLGARTYSDVAHRVFTTERNGGLPRDGVRRPARGRARRAREVRAALEASDLRISFPVEIRVAPADDIPLSTAQPARLLLPRLPHPPRRRPRGLLRAGRADPARPRRPPALGQGAHPGGRRPRRLYPRFEDFLAMRDRLDPDRVFANAYLRRVLGD